MRRDAVRRRRIVVAIVFTVMAMAALAAGAAVGQAGNASQAGNTSRPMFSPARTVTIDCGSAALGGSLPANVYLPAGYPNGSAHYRVIYFLHGLPANPDTYKSNAFVAASLSAGQHAIVVAPQGPATPTATASISTGTPPRTGPRRSPTTFPTASTSASGRLPTASEIGRAHV